MQTKLEQYFESKFASLGVNYLKTKLEQSKITNLDNLQLFMQKRFLKHIIEDMYGNSAITARNELFEYIFEDKAGIYIQEMDFFKGTPPIDFMYKFFGRTLGEQLVKIKDKKNKINTEQDHVQITLVRSWISDIFRTIPELKRNIFTSFAKYIREGQIEENKTLRGIIKNVDSATAKRISSVLLSNLNEIAIINPDLVKNLMNRSGFPEINIQNILKDITLKLGKKEENKGASEFEIMSILRRYLSRTDAKIVVTAAKESAGIVDLHKARYPQKMDFIHFIVNHSYIQAFSPQKASLIKSWLKKKLKL